MGKARQAVETAGQVSGTVAAVAPQVVERRACWEPQEAKQTPWGSPARHALRPVVALPEVGPAEHPALARLHLHREAQTCACTHPARVIAGQSVEFAQPVVIVQQKAAGLSVQTVAGKSW